MQKLLINDVKSNNSEVMSNNAIEEMARIICKPTSNKGNCDKCGFKKQCSKFDDANNLYNAGYSKQEWISVGERLPEESGDYLTYHNGVISALMYSAKHKLFNAADSLSEKYSKKHSITVSHWMPLPEAPKGGAE